MPRPSPALLAPRKSPMQARSAASVDALLDATLQVLLRVGKERLTTTRVAQRAGVSVGTLYQYFPNKSALLQAVLRRHLNEVNEAIERVCLEWRAAPLPEMARALVHTYLATKLKNGKTGVALYAVSSDVDGATIAKQAGMRITKAVAAMLATAREPLSKDPELMASVLQSAMAGVTRKLLESGDPEQHIDALREELIALVCAYLASCSAAVAVP